MRILFVMRHGGYVRNFEWVLRPLAFALRQSISYLRYLSPAYESAGKLRDRWARGTPRLVVRLSSLPWLRSRRGLAALQRLLRGVERLIPRSREIDEHLRSGGYDLVLITPLVDGPSQHDWLRSAKAQGLPAALCVASWDNLTNKGVLFDAPRRTYVWNEIQRREAVELHGLDGDDVVVVGAYPFDHWFDWRPGTSREEFCAAAGLDPELPFVLYVCSSGFIASDERPLVARWIEALRADPELADTGILVRPHPTNGATWAGHPLGGIPNVAVWPPVGEDPTDEERRGAFYDSMYHAEAVVGANTTAMIDAAIVGRRTFSVLLPELRGAQEDTLHFHYLLPENGGALTVASSLEEHVAQLKEARSPDASDDWRGSFLTSFVRPGGLSEPAAPRLVDDLERFAR